MEKVLFSVDSRMRNKDKYPNAEFFRFDQDVNFKNIDYIRLVSVEIPNIFYIYSAARNSNFFKIKDGVGPWTTITITPDYYVVDDLVIELNKQLDAAFGPGIFKFTSTDHSVFTLTRAPPGQFELDFENNDKLYPSLGYYMGFRQKYYKILGGISKITCEATCDVNGENYLFLRVNDWGTLQVQPTIPVRVLAKIPMTQRKGIIVFDNGANFVTKAYIFRQPQNINKLEIELLDAYGNRLDNVGIDYSFTLEVGQIYKKDEYLMKLNSNI